MAKKNEINNNKEAIICEGVEKNQNFRKQYFINFEKADKLVSVILFQPNR